MRTLTALATGTRRAHHGLVLGGGTVASALAGGAGAARAAGALDNVLSGS